MIVGYESLNASVSIAPVVVASATTTTGSACDGTGYRKAFVEFAFGSITDANVTVALSVTASTTSGGAYSAISGVAIAAMAVSTAQSKVHLLEVDLMANGPFLKAVAVTAGGAAYSVPISANVWFIDPLTAPTTARGERDR